MATQAAPSPAAEKVLEKLIVNFTVLSPIHIGTWDGSLLPMEFLYDGQRVHVVDEAKLGRFLMERNLMDDFVHQAFSGNLRRKGLGGVLEERARGTDFKKIGPAVAAYSVPGGGPDMSDFRPFVRDGFGRVYLPGTAIKGVLRTAFFYGALKAKLSGSGKARHPREAQVKQWIQKLQNERKKERAKKFLSARLQKEVLQSWNIPGKANDQNRDILRCLKVRDAYPVNGKVETRVIPIQFLSKRPDGSHYWSQKPKGKGDLVVWVEAVTAGTFQTEILWDQELWRMFSKENRGKKVPAASVKGVLLLADRMNRDIAEHEKAFCTTRGEPQGGFLKSWYEALGGSIFRIGFGSGMLSTTVNLLWSESLRQQIRNVCGHHRGTDPAPKSRRVWVKSEQECLPMGWARIRIVEDEGPDKKKAALAPSVGGQAQESTGKERASGAPEAPIQVLPETRRQKRASSATPSAEASRTAGVEEARKQPPKAPTPSHHGPVGGAAMPVLSKGLVEKAKTVSLTDKIAMERLFKEMERADEVLARKAAEVLKERMEQQNLWKSTPFQVSIQEYLD